MCRTRWSTNPCHLDAHGGHLDYMIDIMSPSSRAEKDVSKESQHSKKRAPDDGNNKTLPSVLKNSRGKKRRKASGNVTYTDPDSDYMP